MRFRPLAALLLPLAVLAATPAAAQLEGRWQVIDINGQALPAESPSEEGTIVQDGAFSFGPDGRFSVSLRADTDNQGPATQRMAGTYATRGDTLTLTSEEGSTSVTDFRWIRRGDTLQLYAEHGNVYRLARAPEAASGEAWTPGTWHAVELNGRAMPAPWPFHPDVTMTQVTFTFTANGRATVLLRGRGDDGDTDDEDTARYRIEGDKLIILDEDDGSVQEEFVWTLRDGRLRLTDDRGNVYTFTRR